MRLPLLSAFWKHHPISDQHAVQLAKKTLDFEEITNCDFIKITPAGTWQAVCHGATDENWENDSLGRRRIIKPLINNVDDWLNLIDFKNSDLPLLNEVIGACKLISKTKPSKPIVFTAFNPITQAIQLCGLENFKEHCRIAPDKVKAGIDKITENTLFIIDSFINAGANGIYYVTQHMQQGLITPELYQDFGEEADMICLNKCKYFDYSIFHLHGENIFLSLSDIPDNCFIHYEHTSENMQPADFHEKYPYKLMLGIPFSIMNQCKDDTEINNCIEFYSQLNPTSNFIVAGCVMPLDFPNVDIAKWVSLAKKR